MARTTTLERPIQMVRGDQRRVVLRKYGFANTAAPILFADEPILFAAQTRVEPSVAVQKPLTRWRIGLFAVLGLGAIGAVCLLTTLLVCAVVIPSLGRIAAARLPVQPLDPITVVLVPGKTSLPPSSGPTDRVVFNDGKGDRDAAPPVASPVAGPVAALVVAMAADSRNLRATLPESSQSGSAEVIRETPVVPDVPEQTAAVSTDQKSNEPVSIQNSSPVAATIPVPVPQPERSALIAVALPIPRPRMAEGRGARAAPLRARESSTVLREAVAALESTAAPQKKQPFVGLLGYANADDGGEATAVTALNREIGTAVYDIEAKAVYLPDGETLEAHSGIGAMRDNPAFVNRRNIGPTPPQIYDLTLREALFHGVEAIRLTPTEGENTIFGRDGLLAHSYLHGKRGDSNGCVVFKDYQRFLAAFKSGRIKRMVVVPHLGSNALQSLGTREQ